MPIKKVMEQVVTEEPIPVEPVKQVKKQRTKKVDLQPLEVPPVIASEVKEVEVKERKATPKPRKQSKWMTALKEYNKTTSKYTIPKKGTSEYDAVQKLMESLTV
jgi:hypothetical protein